MTNMPEHADRGGYKHFAIVTSTVCVPFLILIGSLNTHRGMNWWRTKTKLVFNVSSDVCVWVAKGGPFARKPQDDPEFPRTKSFESSSSGLKQLEPAVTMSTETMSRRQRRLSNNRRDSRGFDKVLEPTARGEAPITGESNGGLRRPTTAFAPGTTSASEPPSTLANMWRNERRQRLRYSEDVQRS